MKQPLFALRSTTDYNQFNFIEHNRDIDPKNLKTIEKSILEHGLKTPLMVTSDGYITDGQHRFISLRKNNLPIWYVINNYSTADDVEIMNNDRRDWVTKDRLHNQAVKGSLSCKKILELTDDWKDDFPFMTVVDAYNSTLNSSSSLIKNKKYDIDIDLGDAVLDNCIKMSDVIERAKQTKFVRALKRIMITNENFDVDHLIKNSYKRKLNVYNREGDIVKEIVEVYNYRKRNNLIKE
jgi:hypothetical protein